MTASKMCASTSLAAGIALALTLGTSGAASAKEVTVRHRLVMEDQLTEIVSYADLDLASTDGEKRLATRVGSAVSHVCAPHRERATINAYGDCKSYAWNGARPQMDLAIQRAHQIALNGVSAIAPVAILIAVPQR